jgi:hypothetical protein
MVRADDPRIPDARFKIRAFLDRSLNRRGLNGVAKWDELVLGIKPVGVPKGFFIMEDTAPYYTQRAMVPVRFLLGRNDKF